MHDIVERLMVMAAAKKPATKKYTRDVENAFDELLMHAVDNSDYTQSDRAFRLLTRIKKALESEGYSFREKVTPLTPGSVSVVQTHTGKAHKNLVSLGGICTMNRSRPMKGMDLLTTLSIIDNIGSKQCYQFTIKPRDKDLVRKNGVNISLPKPLTWSKLCNYGLTLNTITVKDTTSSYEAFTAEGIVAYTTDRITFYTSNAGMSRRWVSSVDEMSEKALSR